MEDINNVVVLGRYTLVAFCNTLVNLYSNVGSQVVSLAIPAANCYGFPQAKLLTRRETSGWIA